jgi:hypothetical protein
MLPCCQPASKKSQLARRSLGALGWAAPSAVLALMPKCPACVAAYLALATGIGVSLPTASLVRILLIVICVAWLTWCAARQAHRFFAGVTFKDIADGPT